MNFKKEILSQNNDCRYMALYGWQDSIGGESYIQYGYINGYKTAGDYLVDYAVENSQQDSLIFPIMFNYRQYIELLLKYICRQNQNDVDYQKTIKFCKHSLIDVFKTTLDFDNVKQSLNEKNMNFMEDVIDFFEKYDKCSFNFRFPLDLHLKNSIVLDENKELRINMQVLKKAIDDFDTILFGFYGI